MLALLDKLRSHMRASGADEEARQAARDVMRYFDKAAPQHHRDEELHVFPMLVGMQDEQLIRTIVGTVVAPVIEIEHLLVGKVLGLTGDSRPDHFHVSGGCACAVAVAIVSEHAPGTNSLRDVETWWCCR